MLTLLAALSASAAAAPLDWLVGTWRGGGDGVVYEETWQAPVAGTMLGTFRFAKGDAVAFYELMTLSTVQNEGGTPPSIRPSDSASFGFATIGATELRIRHFGGDLVAWEPKAKPLRFTIAEADDTHAVFTAVPGPTRLVYTRAGDALEVRLEKDEVHTFTFSRVSGS